MALTKPRAYQIYDIDYKQATRVITVANVTLSGGAPSQVDGVNLSLNDRVLATGQTNKAQNGIYEVATVGSGANGTWIRSGDTNTTGELLAGTIVMVTEGLIYADTQWKLVTNDPITIGVSELVFEQNSAFAFGNVYANGTAVLASSVGDVLTLSPGNNISISGNNTSKTVTIGVTGISLNSISNGTSNVNVVSSGGNVTVGVAGTSNVAVFSSDGLAVTGNITGNGVGLSGINTFKTVAVTGGNTIVADSIADTLTISAGSGIVIIADSATDTLTISTGGTGDSIFATGGDMELITNVVTESLDLGLVTEAVTENNDLGGFFIEGFVSNDNFLPNSIYGNVLLANAVIATTGNITAGYFIGNGSALTGVVAGAPNAVVNGTTNISTATNGNANITIGGTSNVAVFSTTGVAISGSTVVTYAPASATGVAITASGANTQGGTGYADFLRATNASSGATNPSKTFRLNSIGGIEIINSAYSATLLTLTDAGALSVGSTVSSTGFNVNNKQAVNGPAFRAFIAVSQTITSGSQQKVTFGSETFDTNGNFASSRFTPTVEGYYQLNATVRISGSSGTGEVMITIWKNGSEYARGTNEGGTEQGANWYSMQVSDLAYANGTGDYFEIYVQQSSGGNRDTTAGQNISYFSGAMVRGA
jgi:hypothetical protein